jgi:hypothetical protein
MTCRCRTDPLLLGNSAHWMVVCNKEIRCAGVAARVLRAPDSTTTETATW